MTIISLIGNSVLLVIISAFSCIAGILQFFIPVYLFFVLTAPFYCTLHLCSIAYSVVSIIGSILGSSYRDSERKKGVVLLIVINSTLLLVFLANCGITIAAYCLLNPPSKIFNVAACFSSVVSVCQIVLLIYSIIHIVVICTSFKCRNANRQAEDQENELI